MLVHRSPVPNLCQPMRVSEPDQSDPWGGDVGWMSPDSQATINNLIGDPDAPPVEPDPTSRRINP